MAKNSFTFQGTTNTTQTRTDSNFNEIDTITTGTNAPSALTHDDNGNQILTDNDLQLEWDAFNRLRKATKVSTTNLVAVYTYDCGNRRVRKEVTNSGSLDGTTDFYYSGWRVCEEYDFDGTNEVIELQYVWGATYLDELIVRDDRSGVTIAQLNDGSGSEREFQGANTMFSIHAVTDEAAAVLERYMYDAYGAVVVMDASFNVLSGSAIGQEYLFQGQRSDLETGLMYFKNRYYSTSQGRFIGRDALGYHDNVNLYNFAQGNSSKYYDPLGLAILSPIEIDDYLYGEGVGSFDKRKIGDLWVYENSGGYDPSDTGQEIIGKMISSGRGFVFNNGESLIDHKNARLRIIDLISTKRFGFATGQDNVILNDAYFNYGPGFPRISYKDEALKEEALRELIESANSADYKIACQMATKSIFELTEYDFGGNSRTWTWDSTDPADWIPGDWGYLKNKGFRRGDSPGTEGENLIYVGGGLFWGHYHTDDPRGTYDLPTWKKGIKGWNSQRGLPELDEWRRYPGVGLRQ